MGLRFIDAVILYSSDLSKAVAFYQTLGLAFETEEHEDGPLHYACELGNVHIAIYESNVDTDPRNATQNIATGNQEDNQTSRYQHVLNCALKRGNSGAIQLGLQVDSLDETLALAVAAGAIIVVEKQIASWGIRAVIEDPDGRPIELNQALV